MSGSELSNHRLDIACEVLSSRDPEPNGVAVVTVNPFVPSLYEADSLTPTGAFPTMTLLQILGDDGFVEFESERHQALEAGRALWPQVRMLFQYYLQGNAEMFTRIAKKHLELEWEPSASHQRTTVAYQALGIATIMITGTTGNSSGRVISRFARKHTAAMERHADHLRAFRRRGKASAVLEQDLFTELNRFVEQHEAWEMGLLARFVGAEEKRAFEELVLFRDEFSTVRDLYQHGFELACKCLWPLVAVQNTVKRGSPDDFGDVHPESVPVKQRPKSLEKFDKLSSAYKIAYVAQVPGWESFAVLLDNRRRNTIGHATAYHDLQTGRVVSDVDPAGMTYLEFLSEPLDVFEALSTLAQVLRASRVAASPDFGLAE
ncbi:hypothetical protein SAMN05421630_11561 [Prauserella marina]|uniref:Uncharacterized protein n=1 Tax=Prauserella marina TaxID=530584 RepID=A0A1G6Z148_9PSEU|nr:hypothetical protein [Prauserella marina]PWV71335.1 hypothetical protein DES30_11251 [Prauserella marina]SDD96328.1 hypothetical protein SAMN05421630_11561 [Prauserella marina]